MLGFLGSLRTPAVLIAVALLLSPLATPGSSRDLEEVRAKFVAAHVGKGAVAEDPRWQRALESLERDTHELLASGLLLEDGSFRDIDYAEVPTGSWSPWDHFRRLSLMARAWTTPGQRFHRDPTLRLDIESALSFVPQFYAEGSPTPGNWWFWRIGAPLDLGPVLVLMQGEIDAVVFEAATRALASKIGPSPFYYPTLNALKGQNLAWSAYTHLCLAVITHDEAMALASRDAMAAVARQVSGRDGIQRDFSFHQHGPQLYTGGYGSSFAQTISRFARVTTGTAFALPDQNHRVVSDYMVEGVAWGLYRNYFDVSIIGREVSKPWASGRNGVAALLEMSEVPSHRQAEIRAAATKALETWRWELPVDLAAVASRLSPSGGAGPTGHRHFVSSDYSVLRRDGFLASIRMSSVRTESGERTNGESVIGSRQADGRLHLAQRGDEYFGNDVWPVLDWSRLPGITVEQRPDAASDDYGRGRRSFVGGVSDGRTGVAAMELAPAGSTLEARKAWIFLDDAVVFLTSGVRSSSDHPVETVVNQWPMSGRDAPVTIDGVRVARSLPWSSSESGMNWITVDGVGYYFPTHSTIRMAVEDRQGSWARLGSAAPDETPHSRPVATMWFDHGTRPDGAQAAWVLVPNRTAAEMADWAESAPITVLRNDDAVSAARDMRSGSTGLIFWKAASVDGIAADRPCIVYITRERSGLMVHVADPTQAAATIQLVVPGAWSLAGTQGRARIRESGPATTFEIEVSGGNTTSVALAGRTPRRGTLPPR